MSAWASSTLATVDFETGRLDDRLHLGASARITYGPFAMADMQSLNDAQLAAELQPADRTLIEKAGGRKFALAVLALLLSSFLAWFGRITTEVWQWVAIVAMTGYTSLNVLQKVVGK